MRELRIIFLMLIAVVGFSSCEKVLDVDLPEGVSGIVFEGYIENGQFPYVIISRSSNYFDPIQTAAEAIVNSLVEADSVFVEYDGNRVELPKICLSDLTPEQQEMALELLGFESFPTGLDLCINANFSMVGELGKTYTLRAYVEGQLYSATTTIGNTVAFDSLWYKDEIPVDSFGSIWVNLTDPAATTDYYYVWTENLTQDRGMAPIDGGPSFGDRLFNGETIAFSIYQGSNLANDNGSGEEYWWFREGDTVVVKLGTIDQGVYDFWESVDAASNLNPFSSPTPVFSNFDNGGRGVWAGYATTLDTFVCVK
ncbi:MAG: DUF4249 family protein [Flavobacteriales bacterium]|nr:DUF4249 family protein [Flavobacteriales bacterium]